LAILVVTQPLQVVVLTSQQVVEMVACPQTGIVALISSLLKVVSVVLQLGVTLIRLETTVLPVAVFLAETVAMLLMVAQVALVVLLHLPQQMAQPLVAVAVAVV
jgi:hypothetical protein